MPLTTEQMNMIFTDLMNGGPQRVTGEEADAFAENLKKEIDAATAAGLVLEPPPEWNVDTNGSVKAS